MPGRNRAVARAFIRGLTGAPTHQCEAALTLRAPSLLPFPFPPSRLLAPAELCARRLGPLPCHCNPLSVERPDPPMSNRRAGTCHAGRRRDQLTKAPDYGAVLVAITVAQFYLSGMLRRILPTGFIAPCLPTKTDKLPSGSQWLHEIKHDGFWRAGEAL